MGRMFSSLQPEVDALSKVTAIVRYAKSLGDPESYLGHSEYMSLEDKFYVFFAVTIRVFHRAQPAAAETQGNATALLETLDSLRDAIELEHYFIQFDLEHRLRGGGIYVYNCANMCGLTGPRWVSAAELRGLQAELLEAQQTLNQDLKVLMAVYEIAGDIMDGARESRDRLARAEQTDISLAGRAAEKDVLINSKRWKLHLAQRLAQISDLRE